MIKEEKAEIRRRIKAHHQQVAASVLYEESASIWEQVEQLSVFQEAQTLLFFYSLRDEPYTHEVLQKWCKEKTLLLPAVKGNALELRVYKGKEEMVRGAFGIQEPAVRVFSDWAAIDLAIIPGVAFDLKNYRLGRGKGYYDRLLSSDTFSAFCLGVCFSYQRIATVPTEAHDMAMNKVIDGRKVDNQ